METQTAPAVAPVQHVTPYFQYRKTHEEDVLWGYYPPQHVPDDKHGPPSFIYREHRGTKWFDITNPQLRDAMKQVIPSHYWEDNAVDFSVVQKWRTELGRMSQASIFRRPCPEEDLNLLVDLVEGKLVHELNKVHWESENWRNLSELTAIPDNNDDAGDTPEAWPESFERVDAYIDHLVDPQSHPMNEESLAVSMVFIHGPSVPTFQTWDLQRPWANSPHVPWSLDPCAITPTVGHDRGLLKHFLRHYPSHDLEICVGCSGTFKSSIPDPVNHNMELGRRLKRLFIRRVLRKTLRDKCGELRDLLSTADGSDQTSLHQLSALAENPVRVWKSGLNAINNVLNDVLPKSTQEVISLILMADSMRSVPHLSGGELCGLNEFIHDLHRWKQTINLGDLTIFETFARVMYRLRIDEHVSPSPPMKLLQHFQKSLRDIISQMPVPAQSNAEIPIFPDSCGNQAGSPNTSISWSKLPIIRWDPGDPDLNFYFKVERPIFHAVSRSTAAVVGTVIFGVVLACLLTWQNFLPITNSLKLSWERHGVEDIGWSQSITRNSLIIDSLRRHASAIDGVDLHRRTSSYPSPSPEGHDCGLSYGLLPTLPMVPLPAPQIWHSPQQGTTPTLSSGRSSTASVQQQRPRSTTLGSETSTTSKRSQKPTPCAFCKRLFSNSTNAHKHMRNAAKCRRRPKPPEKFPCDVCGTMVGQYYAKDHCELNRRSQNKG